MMADIDVTDVTVEGGMVTVFAAYTEFDKIKTTLTEENPAIHFELEEITFELFNNFCGGFGKNMVE